MANRQVIQQLLESVEHRPWALCTSPWTYYQEWNEALFFHWSVPPEELEPLLPKNLELNLLDGKAWVSVVAFTMQKIHPKKLFPLSLVSDFLEVNVRTYVSHQDKDGVYFLNIEAGKSLSAWVSKKLSGLPYEKAAMTRTVTGNFKRYQSQSLAKGFSLDITYSVGPELTNRTPLDAFLTERYSLYLERGGQLHRYEIHHLMWPLHKLQIQAGSLSYKVGQTQLMLDNVEQMHYSEGVKVVAWPRETLPG
ncbi:DUF2071 domain-containing protein [Nibribacter koreensis]|uniref:DUF2071 domain-containing protein n=1 Tax=Nibribacter koreensis TaxID=1084519 RepID=A0ABP8FTW9_9BACT